MWEQAPERLRALLLDPPTFFQLFCEYEGKPIRLDGWQVAFLRSPHRYRAVEKSVQIGFSWVCAMEALHAALFYMDETSAFISVNEADAHEKVLYARKLYEGIDPEIKRFVPVSKDSTEEFWVGPRERPARLISLPATSGLRGRAAHIYLDEIEFYKPGQDESVFTAAMGRITRGHRRITVGSSVFGEDTVLSRLMNGDQYPDFLKFRLPWWATENPDVLEGIESQRRNMAPEDFAQEYECVRADAADSAFPQNLIRKCWNELEETGIPIDRLDPAGTFVAGFDPGGSRHPAVLSIVQRDGNFSRQVTQIALRGEALAAQQARLDDALRRLPGLELGIDQLGVGLQMTQALHAKWGARVHPVLFTEQSKSEMTLALKKAMEEGELSIVRDRELAHQLNKTRRMPGGKIIQKDAGSRSHFDKYWALAMAVALMSGNLSIYESRGMRVVNLADDFEYAQSWGLDTGYLRRV